MSITNDVAWNEEGLVPAVAIDSESGRFLMLAWMNREALEATLRTYKATFYSRSRQQLWQKGETSGNTLIVTSIRLDCDGDTIVIDVRPQGPACHTGRASCAFRQAISDEWIEDDGPIGAPAAILDQLYATCRERRASTAEKSYTKSLFEGGADAIAKKLSEETGELIDELSKDGTSNLVHETADLLFHVVVGLAYRGIDPRRVWTELRRRAGVSGHEEKRQRKETD